MNSNATIRLTLALVCLLMGVFDSALGKDEPNNKLLPQKPKLDAGTNSTQLQTGTGTTELQGGAGTTELQGGTSTNLLEGNAKINTLTIQDWQKMDLKGFMNQARLMPAIPATARFVASEVKYDENILKAKTTLLDPAASKSDAGLKVKVHLVRCPPADPLAHHQWQRFEAEMRNESRAAHWEDWESRVEEVANSAWDKNAAGTGAMTLHVIIDSGFKILEVSDPYEKAFASVELETAARKTLDLISRSAPHYPASGGIDKVHLRITFTNGR